MKKSLTYIFASLFVLCTLSGCTNVKSKSIGISFVYGTAAVLSLCLLIGCWLVVKKNKKPFILLFLSVFAVNVGYTVLSLSDGLNMALNANRFSYFGSVFLPFSMLMIILNVTNTAYKKWVSIILLTVAVSIFLLASSYPVLDLYYKEASFEIINGVSTLKKVYGPLHPLYLVYLMGYFVAMVAVIIRASVKKRIESFAHAVVLATAVFVNIGVWFIEQFVSINFEMLSVSYIISELFLLGIHLVLKENQRLKDIVKRVETIDRLENSAYTDAHLMIEKPIEDTMVDADRIEMYIKGIETLTATEKAIYEAHISRATTKEIMANLNISENTIKYHNKNLYSKLGVSSKKELLEIYKQLRTIKFNLN